MWLTPTRFINILIGQTWCVYLGSLFMLVGILTDAIAAFMFMSAKTSISPIAPQNASVLIQHGLFKVTRNPMYLGMTILLVGWALVLQNLTALYGPLFFVVYITRFQILPEERILTQKWGDHYTAYVSKTKRWL